MAYRHCASNYEAPTHLSGHCIHFKHVRDTDRTRHVASLFKFIKETAQILANVLQGRIDWLRGFKESVVWGE